MIFQIHLNMHSCKLISRVPVNELGFFYLERVHVVAVQKCTGPECFSSSILFLRRINMALYRAVSINLSMQSAHIRNEYFEQFCDERIHFEWFMRREINCSMLLTLLWAHQIDQNTIQTLLHFCDKGFVKQKLKWDSWQFWRKCGSKRRKCAYCCCECVDRYRSVDFLHFSIQIKELTH